MSWFKVDDRFAFHPKVIMVGNEAIGVWIRLASWCAERLTDGKMANAMANVMAKSMAGEAGEGILGKLVDARLLDQDPSTGDYYIHDYLDYNPSAEEVRANRELVSAERSKAGKRGAARRWQNGKADGKQDGKTMAPIPIPKDPPTEDPIYATVVAAYFAGFKTARNVEPPFGGREGKAVKQLIAKVGGEQAIAAIRNAFADTWWGSRATIVSIASDPAKFVGDPVKRVKQGFLKQPAGDTDWEAQAMAEQVKNDGK